MIATFVIHSYILTSISGVVAINLTDTVARYSFFNWI